MTTVPHGDDAANWVRRLQLTRAGHWFAGNHGDPYALILRAATDDPQRYEDELTAHGPVFRSDALDTWVTGDPAVAREVLADPRFGWLDRAGQRPAERTLPLAGTALDHGPETRARLDALCAPADAEGVRLRAGKACADLLAAAGDRFDAAVLARRVVAVVLADALGVPEDRQDEFERALTGAGRTLDSRLCPQTIEHATAQAAATGELAALLAAVLGAEPDDDRTAAALSLAVAVAEPAVTLCSNAIGALLARPGRWALLAADPDRAAAAVEETLRRFPPVRLESRVAQRDVTVGGTLIPADGHLVVLVAAANRAPDGTFDIGRDAEPALGLTGVPYPAGAAELIRTIAAAVLRVLAERAPGLAADGPGVRWRRSPVLLGHARLPVARTTTEEAA